MKWFWINLEWSNTYGFAIWSLIWIGHFHLSNYSNNTNCLMLKLPQAIKTCMYCNVLHFQRCNNSVSENKVITSKTHCIAVNACLNSITKMTKIFPTFDSKQMDRHNFDVWRDADRHSLILVFLSAILLINVCTWASC